VAWPGVLDAVQRRAHVRYQFDWPIHFRHLDPATQEPHGKPESGMTINVSAGGLLLETDIELSVGEEVELTLPLHGGAEVKTHGVVVRAQDADDDEPRDDDAPKRTAVAVKFTRITAVDQERIVRFVLLTEHRRREAGTRPLQVQALEPGE
jgi:c-di-GMP-binding flagellar brake protein YcgR